MVIIEKKFNINLDLKRKLIQMITGLKQGDNNDVLYIKLLQDSLAYDLTGLTVRLNLKRPDQEPYFQGVGSGVEITDVLQGSVKVSILSEILDIPGEIQADLSIFEGENKISSGAFKMVVEESVYSEGALPNRQGGDLIQSVIGNEQERIDAEAVRIAAETLRDTDETTRLANEGTRVTAEDIRINSETNRVNAEGVRVTAEDARLSAETSRGNAETTRLSQESARVTAEASRVTVESARVTAESSRATAETNRTNAESSRVTAETGRSNAETSRVTAETDRVTQFNVIKDGATLFDVLPVTTVRNSIELNPLGTYNYVSGNTVTANSLTTMESGQTDLNYAVTLQVSNEKVYSKTSYGFEVDKMIRDIILTQ